MKKFQVFGNDKPIRNKETVSLTLGNFDGVHRGHKSLIQDLKDHSKAKFLGAITFEPHPAFFFCKEDAHKILMTLDDKINYLLDTGLDFVVVQRFDEDFSRLKANDFCTKWLYENFRIETIVLGYDFHYGLQRQGDYKHMKSLASQLNWQVFQAHALKLSTHGIVSTSLIKSYLEEGYVESATELLGHMHVFHGPVIEGDKRGAKLGYKTANLNLPETLFKPKNGVYACYVEIDGDGVYREAIMNCGVRPTFDNSKRIHIEVHIYNFSKDIYGSSLKVFIVSFLREEKKFNSLEALKTQISHDIQESKKYFKENKILTNFA